MFLVQKRLGYAPFLPRYHKFELGYRRNSKFLPVVDADKSIKLFVRLTNVAGWSEKTSGFPDQSWMTVATSKYLGKRNIGNAAVRQDSQEIPMFPQTSKEAALKI